MRSVMDGVFSRGLKQKGLTLLGDYNELKNPKLASVKMENIVDCRIMRKLKESGFIDRVYVAQGAM